MPGGSVSEAGVAVTAQGGGDSLLTRANSLVTAFSRARIQDRSEEGKLKLMEVPWLTGGSCSQAGVAVCSVKSRQHVF